MLTQWDTMAVHHPPQTLLCIQSCREGKHWKLGVGEMAIKKYNCDMKLWQPDNQGSSLNKDKKYKVSYNYDEMKILILILIKSWYYIFPISPTTTHIIITNITNKHLYGGLARQSDQVASGGKTYNSLSLTPGASSEQARALGANTRAPCQEVKRTSHVNIRGRAEEGCGSGAGGMYGGPKQLDETLRT